MNNAKNARRGSVLAAAAAAAAATALAAAGASADITCPENSMLSQPAADENDAIYVAGSDVQTNTRWWDSYEVSGDICTVRWWGITTDEPILWEACIENPMQFEITFCEDDSGMPGAIANTGTYTVTGTPTGLFYLLFPVYEMYEYEVDLAACVSLRSGWFSIRGTTVSDPPCVFRWMSVPFYETVGDEHAWKQTIDPPAWEWIDYYDYSICLVGNVPPWDLDGDGLVAFQDLLQLLASWGECEVGEPCPGDFDGNGFVDFQDLLALLANWSP